MQTIFIQIKCELGRAYEVADKLMETGFVSEVYAVSGNYDLIAKCHLDDGVDIARFVIGQVQMIKGVRDTYTFITLKAFT